MANFFFDTEFCEGYKKPISWLPTIGSFNKPYHAIELISIGMVAEDGRTYYAISSGLNKWQGFTDDYFELLKKNGSDVEAPILYAYFADYDWVVFCSLFGTMMELPNSFPMYCRDLKQMLDEKIEQSWVGLEMTTFGHEGLRLDQVKKRPDYPQQTNEHNAASDAKWNLDLYKFIQKL